MAINFEKALGIHQYTLGIRSKRSEMLASNIANADTPNYKARDISFSDALAAAKSGNQFSLEKTNTRHFTMQSDLQPGIKFRQPNQPDTGDGNTVDVQVERNQFMQNSMEYQASLSFLNSKIASLRKAIKGQ
ncbi:flagellar basal body rod protein FlgB [Motilimonas cestriensis]|uniref:Flagellar basal body rod protein FlgB n=1 Tax=Motilimonas cestriensis TaxID=2742685 RepID=A0ABS8WCX8_9GAMM|nr:flagellar basal body rod protein FlgB [Motilimonas cestriensis]MCE2595611.1 flagellar basal body rod protein FlgB [Motilimonas cestriensis]